MLIVTSIETIELVTKLLNDSSVSLSVTRASLRLYSRFSDAHTLSYELNRHE